MTESEVPQGRTGRIRKAQASLIARHDQVVTLNQELKALGQRENHSCYVCYDDWAFARRRCYDRQLNALNIQLLVAVSDMKPSDSDTNTELPLSRPGGGSQDSIDKLNQILSYMYSSDGLDEDGARDDILAWHNTQLKAVLESLRKTIPQHMADYESQTLDKVREAIDDMQANLEEQK